MEREQLNLKVAHAARIPDVAIDLIRGEDLKARIVGPVVGVSFALPLWNRNEGAISAAESKVTEAEATLRATRLQIHQTLLTAYRTWGNGQETSRRLYHRVTRSSGRSRQAR